MRAGMPPTSIRRGDSIRVAGDIVLKGLLDVKGRGGTCEGKLYVLCFGGMVVQARWKKTAFTACCSLFLSYSI